MEIQVVSFLKIENQRKREFLVALKDIPEIQKMQVISGYFDILIEIGVQISEELVRIFELIEQIPGLKEIHSHFVLEVWQK
ncbi:Lrp/AsnC ligand binding domain-containing protein [Candidatus Harpocratesius sp.]